MHTPRGDKRDPSMNCGTLSIRELTLLHLLLSMLSVGQRVSSWAAGTVATRALKLPRGRSGGPRQW